MFVQICAFAQLPLFTSSPGDPGGHAIRDIMREAAGRDEVDCIGSTPYVESDDKQSRKNIKWMIDLSAEKRKHLDFHVDYNLDPKIDPMVWEIVGYLKHENGTSRVKRLTFGTC
jgi:hypothetical protein